MGRAKGSVLWEIADRVAGHHESGPHIQFHRIISHEWVPSVGQVPCRILATANTGSRFWELFLVERYMDMGFRTNHENGIFHFETMLYRR